MSYKVTEDITTTSTDINNLTGEEQKGSTERTLTLAFDDGRVEHIDLDGSPLRSQAGELWMWWHSMSGGSMHGGSADSMDEALAIALADAADPECQGTSSYLSIVTYPKGRKKATVHLGFRRPNVALGEPWHGMSLCGRVIDGHRIGYRLDGGLTLCGSCRRSY